MSERRITETDGSYWPTVGVRGFTNEGDLIALGKKCDNYQEMSGMAYRAADKKKRQHFPTPTTVDAGTGRFNTSVGSSNARPTLAMMAKKDMWPTPTTRDYKGGYSTDALTRKDGKSRKFDALPNAVLDGMGSETVSGKLNPMWVAWLMGFPIGFNNSKDWVTPKSRSKPQSPTDCSEESKQQTKGFPSV
jgi:hypothetical protein